MLKRLIAAGTVIFINLMMPAMAFYEDAGAMECPDVKIIFARGSGEKRWEDQNFRTFRQEIEEKLKMTSIRYEFEDLDYPAISVANPLTLISTFISGGEAYEFGASIAKGINNLTAEIENPGCPQTKYVIAGYSQGAMLVSKAVQSLNAEKIIYAATFGDPKIYLPEGAGAVPAACSGKNLSNYRIYVPDCRAYFGMLGWYKPYQPEAYVDKLGTWCNKADFFCSSHLSMRDHTSYVADEIYADASKLIFDKITKALGVSNDFVSLHDTAILIDSTGSMLGLIDKYKAEAMKLARETLESGGRVALYDYRDIRDRYEPRERCNFETCTLETFALGLEQITVNGGGDTPESLLSASFHMMQRLDWKYGATKSVIVLTDANYHNPDIDGVTFDQVVRLSKSIDPVNFYIITPEREMDGYRSLAEATDGAVVSSADDLSLLTRTIMERYDSLPRVEEDILGGLGGVLPAISDAKYEVISADRLKLSWQTTGTRTLVILNDLVLGVTEENEIVLGNLDFSAENIVRLVPLSENDRGEAVEMELKNTLVIPKAPDTGRAIVRNCDRT